MNQKIIDIDHPVLLEDTVVFRMAVAVNLNVSSGQRDYTNKYGLKITDWRVLMLLAEHKMMSPTELSDVLAVDKMTITRSVKRLLKGKVIKASRSSEDYRKLNLTVERKGAEIYNELAPKSFEHQSTLLSDLSPAEQLMLKELLAKVMARGRIMLSQAADQPSSG